MCARLPGRTTAIRTVLLVSSVLAVASCAVFTVHPSELQRGDPSAMAFVTSGGPSYDEVWAAALHAMRQNMTLIEQDRATGTVRSRVGPAHTGKVVALFIAPTSPHAAQYKIEIISKQPMGFGQPVLQTHEPKIVDDLSSALRAPRERQP